MNLEKFFEIQSEHWAKVTDGVLKLRNVDFDWHGDELEVSAYVVSNSEPREFLDRNSLFLSWERDDGTDGGGANAEIADAIAEGNDVDLRLVVKDADGRARYMLVYNVRQGIARDDTMEALVGSRELLLVCDNGVCAKVFRDERCGNKTAKAEETVSDASDIDEYMHTHVFGNDPDVAKYLKKVSSEIGEAKKTSKDGYSFALSMSTDGKTTTVSHCINGKGVVRKVFLPNGREDVPPPPGASGKTVREDNGVPAPGASGKTSALGTALDKLRRMMDA